MLKIHMVNGEVIEVDGATMSDWIKEINGKPPNSWSRWPVNQKSAMISLDKACYAEEVE